MKTLYLNRRNNGHRYPHAGNDVFYVKGLHNGSQINAYVKSARQRGADISNELSIAELQTFLKGYRQFGTCDTEAVKTYMAQCYVYFLQLCGDDAEYCAYIREWQKAFACI